jgi:hypothetical protein
LAAKTATGATTIRKDPEEEKQSASRAKHSHHESPSVAERSFEDDGRSCLALGFVALRGKWRYVTSGNFGLKDKGAVTVGFYTQAVEKYRVRTSFRGDKDHLKDVSPWAYFRTTN